MARRRGVAVRHAGTDADRVDAADGDGGPSKDRQDGSSACRHDVPIPVAPASDARRTASDARRTAMVQIAEPVRIDTSSSRDRTILQQGFPQLLWKDERAGSPPPADGGGGSRITRRRRGVRPAMTVKLNDSSYLGTLRHRNTGEAADTDAGREAVEEAPGQEPSACDWTPGINSLHGDSWPRPQAHVFTRLSPRGTLCPMQSAFVQARRKSKGAVPATGAYGSVSARSHQTLPKLTNGPSSVEMRVRTW